MSILDLGCGAAKMQGACGLDKCPYPGVDIVADLDVFPWPLASNSFSQVHFRSSLEHLTDIPAVMEEVFRISAPSAKIFIHVPHFSSSDNYEDVTHKHRFSFFSFDRFLDPNRVTGLVSCKYRLLSRRIEFWILSEKIRMKPHFIMEILANRFPHMYERFLAFIFPARSLHVILEVVKQA